MGRPPGGRECHPHIGSGIPCGAFGHEQVGEAGSWADREPHSPTVDWGGVGGWAMDPMGQEGRVGPSVLWEESQHSVMEAAP